MQNIFRDLYYRHIYLYSKVKKEQEIKKEQNHCSDEVA